jgi:hypothetical protein
MILLFQAGIGKEGKNHCEKFAENSEAPFAEI